MFTVLSKIFNHRAFHNCCSCCCTALHCQVYVGAPMFANSGYVAAVDTDKCIGCGACVEKCNFNAITMSGDKPVIDTTTCMGCEACVKSCAVGAIEIKPGENGIEPMDLKAIKAAQE